ncbi:MAG: cation-translocating P-type ATPase [Bacteroidetes bacterium]|nr:cation-translocating P-type ATPase [Bacteroidota bacterium]
MNWHVVPLNLVFERLNTRPSGLSQLEAEQLLQTQGPNLLVEPTQKPVWRLIVQQFEDIMILILVAAALVSGFIGDVKDTIVILIIVILNALIGFIQEYRAAKAMDALKKMTATMARVRRDEMLLQISAAELAPGDIVLLETGDMVPADLRLIETHALRIQESALTGESHAVEKRIDTLTDERTPLGDRVNMAYKSTLVSYGRGIGVVVATGMRTEIGGIAQMLQTQEQATPLQRRLAKFGKTLSVISIAICVGLFVIGWLRGEEPLQMLLTALSVAVAAIPEALPAVVTIALALGARKMVRSQALIRKLPAVETLGSITYICTDKTGTLTQNRMHVKTLWTANAPIPELPGMSNEAFLVLAMYANQDTAYKVDGSYDGDPTEIALAEYARTHPSFDAAWGTSFPRVYEIPFDSERKLMSTVHAFGDNYLVLTKGALESVLERSRFPDPVLSEKAEALSAAGMRVLTYAYRILQEHPETLDHVELESQLHCLGLAGLIDPPRLEAQQAVSECIEAGIVPVMITGDHPATAAAIAREIGILQGTEDRVVTGRMLEAMTPSEFQADIYKIKVYARVSPEQKLHIVKTLQDKRQFVAMTGDGVNDAPALKRADIGVAMGITGSDVSKEAADMILLDDNFASIVHAVREGRRIYDNIRKFIKYIMTGNSGEIWAITLAPILGLPIPLLPIHILWMNLITDGLPSLALANEPPEADLMKRPPRKPDESIFSGGMGWHILWVGFLMGLVCLGLQYYSIEHQVGHWQTMVFTVLCMSQIGHVLAVKSESAFFYQQSIRSNLLLNGAVLFTILLQLALIYVPFFQDIFQTQALDTSELVLVSVLSTLVFHAVELEKWIKWRNKKRRLLSLD